VAVEQRYSSSSRSILSMDGWAGAKSTAPAAGKREKGRDRFRARARD